MIFGVENSVIASFIHCICLYKANKKINIYKKIDTRMFIIF